MFGQLVPWYDCNNDCTFCSQRDMRERLTVSDKRRRLMMAARFISHDSTEYTRFGLIGGELFDEKGLDREWRCVAEVIGSMRANDLYFASHLIGDVEPLYKFLGYIPKGKRITVCTSYDTVGRFHTPEAKESWVANLERVHDEGYNICCTCILTQEFVTSEPDIPDYVHTTLVEPLPNWGYWYYRYDAERDGDYRERLLNDMNEFPLNLPMRNDTLNWLRRHEVIARHYADYTNAHADDIYEYIDGEYVMTTADRFSKPQCKCGHQYGASCYADSPKCIQCDIKELFEW